MNPFGELLGEWTLGNLLADVPDLAGFQGVVEPGQECSEREAHPESLFLETLLVSIRGPSVSDRPGGRPYPLLVQSRDPIRARTEKKIEVPAEGHERQSAQGRRTR